MRLIQLLKSSSSCCHTAWHLRPLLLLHCLPSLCWVWKKLNRIQSATPIIVQREVVCYMLYFRPRWWLWSSIPGPSQSWPDSQLFLLAMSPTSLNCQPPRLQLPASLAQILHVAPVAEAGSRGSLFRFASLSHSPVNGVPPLQLHTFPHAHKLPVSNTHSTAALS